MGLLDIIAYPLGWVIWFFYQFLGNSYVLSLFLFTIFVRLLLLPSTLKQQKSMVKTARLKPKMDALQKKYGKNKEKYQQELMKLYEKEGYNPMSGCTPLLIQMPVLFGLINVVYKPLTHIIRMPKDVLGAISKAVGHPNQTFQLDAMSQMNNSEFIGKLTTELNTIGADANGVIEQIKSIDLNFLGMDLGQKPTWAFNLLILIPIISLVTSFLVSYISQKNMQAQNPDAAAAGGCSGKSMMYIMPLFSFFFSFNFPAGLGLYWIFSNIASGVQTVVLHKVYNPQRIAAEQEAAEEQAKEEERQARIEAKKAAQKARAEGEVVELDEAAMSQKELNKKKIADARKRIAEKYGEEYDERQD